MERRVTPPRRVTSPTRGPPPPCKQALRMKETDGWQLNILDTHGLHQDGNLKTRTVTYTSIPCKNEPGFFWWNSPSEDIICEAHL